MTLPPSSELQSKHSKGSSAEDTDGLGSTSSGTGELGRRRRRSLGWGRAVARRCRHAGGHGCCGVGSTGGRSGSSTRCGRGRGRGRGRSGSGRSGTRAAAVGGDGDSDAVGGASVLDLGDDVGLLGGCAVLLHAGSDGSEEGIGLLAVALEVLELRAAIGSKGTDKAVELYKTFSQSSQERSQSQRTEHWGTSGS